MKTKSYNSDINNHTHEKENVAIIEFLYHWDYFITTIELLSRKYNVHLIVGESFIKNLSENYNINLFTNNSRLRIHLFHLKIGSKSSILFYRS